MAKDVADLMQFLPSIALFGGLEQRTLEKIISMMAVQELVPGSEVCKQGEAGRSMFVVRSGEAVVYRENVTGGRELLEGVSWILPDRRLTAEIERVLAARLVRGADLWHLASALYLAESPGDVDFLTLDAAQRDAAATLGFRTPL